MKKFSKEDGEQLAKAAQKILNDPKLWAEAQEYFKEAANEFAKKLGSINREAEDAQLIKVEQSNDCDHGVTFDEEDAKKIGDSHEIRKKYPRGYGLCPKGCGYNGIAYASYMHYIMGDY
jgi:hypothetical protein